MKLQNFSNKSKRLQKKLYLGEFAVLGFEFSCRVNCQGDATFDGFIDDVITYAEGHQLMVAGGGDPDDFKMFVLSENRYGSTSLADQDALKRWLAQNPLVSDVIVGPLIDAYYGV
jgi:uncharacterized protein YggL (DUF469 family)